jgi:nicotinate phosphoribosyltransferase
MRLNKAAFTWLQEQTASEEMTSMAVTVSDRVLELLHVSITPDELEYLRKECPYLDEAYLNYLKTFRLHPSEQVELSFKELDASEYGDLNITVRGLWVETILYEIPLLALTSEAYFKFCNTDWDYCGQEERAYSKGRTLLDGGCHFSDFGSRRRRDYHTQDLVIQGLLRASKESGTKGKLTGTSNVHFAMKHGIPPVGTVAHEWYMGIAAITNNYEQANELGLRYWVGCFGEGVRTESRLFTKVPD